MKGTRIFRLAGISVVLSIFGFMLDLHERVDSIWVNLLDVVLMATVIFCILMTVLGLGRLATFMFSQLKNAYYE